MDQGSSFDSENQEYEREFTDFIQMKKEETYQISDFIKDAFSTSPDVQFQDQQQQQQQQGTSQSTAQFANLATYFTVNNVNFVFDIFNRHL